MTELFDAFGNPLGTVGFPLIVEDVAQIAPVPQDFSVNKKSLSNQTLLQTVYSNNNPLAPAQRIGGYVIQNLDVYPLTIVFDDGNGGNSTQFSLSPSIGTGYVGGFMNSSLFLFTGRIQVYGTLGASVLLRVW
jgi:hypothetical protein